MILQRTIKVGNLVWHIDVHTCPEHGSVAVKYNNISKAFTDIAKLDDYLLDIVASVVSEMNEIENRNAELNAYLKGFGFVALSNEVI